MTKATEQKGRQRFTTWFMWLVIGVGMTLLLASVYHLPHAILNFQFFLLALFTLAFGSQIGVEIPRIGGRITVADTLVFLTMLLFGGEAAVCLAAGDGMCAALRISRKPRTILFNSAVMVCATFLSSHAFKLCIGAPGDLPDAADTSHVYIVALCLVAVIQYVVNSGLVAIVAAFKTNQPVFETWRKYYLWTSITYFAGISAAAVSTKLISAYGFYSLFATFPIIVIVYFTYQTYLKNVAASEAQAEQSKHHVEELSRHITELERLDAERASIAGALQKSEEQFRTAFDCAGIGMALVGLDGRWLRVNESLCKIVGYPTAELLAGSSQAITHADDHSADVGCINQLLEGKAATCQLEKRYIHKLGHSVWASVNVSLVRDGQSGASHCIFQIQDITDRKRAEERLVHDALHDSLTGLPNRALFMDHLELAIKRAKRNDDYKFAALFLDFDRFKIINDSLGHLVGDQLLVGIARRLESCLRPGDTIARLGGDEFTILLEDIAEVGEAAHIATRLQQVLSVPFNLSGHEVFASASIGIAPSSIGYDRAADILRDADTAMYRAKSGGRARYEIFDNAMHARALNLMQLETDLRHAVERREFSVHYQPIVALDTNLIQGFEALVRWQHPERGFISPLDFISVAEETGAIIPIGEFVLTEACRQLRAWQEQCVSSEPLFVSVNLSCKQLIHPDLIEKITAVLRDTNLDLRSLRLEITESAVMENIEVATVTLERLHALGVGISIDDFGTGYSSLSYLHRFPVDTLKVDRSFVSRMSGHDENAEIVRTIVVLARNLGMKVVAEGVETKDQQAHLRALDCEYGQGYLYSKPLTAATAEQLFLNSSTYPLDTPEAHDPTILHHGLAA